MKDIRLVRQVLTHNIHLCIKRMKIINLQLMNGDFISSYLQNIQIDLPKNNLTTDIRINIQPDDHILQDKMEEKAFIT
ncbi:hypothetical protein PFNF135_05192 [Plasmodium falciparum NF135/5.C10]|uniref:Uncharacterized protein n=3 Tax=Plasmodium falciparum TaxID=5833 RepID=A0A024X0Q0_PLAFC|nr:hypothetical protein PFFVO_04619 [Plasmodium falciparum Vietnam Oak-Knoll (FVO)]ETW40365.1 hypothetical protein PFNF135_05192 [Plasmodium falciparum NF135/5.C10]ETW59084.1 hypothetical protein PFMC_04965 [Plasmodium falciparum CAMP/Malaysia]